MTEAEKSSQTVLLKLSPKNTGPYLLLSFGPGDHFLQGFFQYFRLNRSISCLPNVDHRSGAYKN